MGCTRRHFLLTTCLLQLITIIERQVFDFLGYMWAPILVNFFHIIFVIFGFYGAYHFRVKYVIAYLVWCFIWIGWNAFLICFYLDIGILDRNSDILNLGTGSVSWFEVNGYGCKPNYPTNITSDDPYRPVRPETVEDCFVDYPIVEIIHSGLQCILAVFAIVGAILIAYLFIDEDDQLSALSKKSKHRQSLYSIEYGAPIDTIRSRRSDTILDYDEAVGNGDQLSPKPMTPRRVKRRSVMTRGTNGRQSTTSRRSNGGTNRNSTRSSRRKIHQHQNPVTKLMEQQQQQLQNNNLHPPQNPKPQFASFTRLEASNSKLTALNLQSLNQDLLSDGSRGTATSISTTNLNKTQIYKSFKKNISPDPIYYNTNSSALERHSPEWNLNNSSPIPVQPVDFNATSSPGGHFNPSYQHSTSNLTNNDNEHVDDLYNNRPPSVRSSYSNFHGTRPLSSYNVAPIVTENVFAGIVKESRTQQLQQEQLLQQQQLQQQQPPPPIPHQHYQLQYNNNQVNNGMIQQPQIITPSSRRSASRESIRSMAFLNNGPPAYNLNYHTPPDSETTM